MITVLLEEKMLDAIEERVSSGKENNRSELIRNAINNYLGVHDEAGDQAIEENEDVAEQPIKERVFHEQQQPINTESKDPFDDLKKSILEEH